MPLIECKLGPNEVPVGGQFYAFKHDRAGRAVAEVHNLRHVECFLALECYRRVEPLPDPKAPEPVKDDPGQNGDGDTTNAESGGNTGSADQGEGGSPAGAAGPGENAEPFVDDIIAIKGIGAALKKKLAEHGITSLYHIAEMAPETEAKLDAELGLHGRIARDGWVDQAKTLLTVEGADQGEG